MNSRIRRVLSVMIILAFLMSNVVVYAEGESMLPKYYKEMFEGISESRVCIEDCSYSMDSTFSYEKGIIERNLSEIEFEENYFFKSSNIWNVLSKASEEYNKIVLISDLWDTTDEELAEANKMSLTIVVPYWSDDEEAVNHIEDIIWEKVLLFWSNSTVTVIYLDGYIDTHSNCC